MKPLLTRLAALAASITVTLVIINSMAYIGHPPPASHTILTLMSPVK